MNKLIVRKPAASNVKFLASMAALVVFSVVPQVGAQVGNNNPGGVAGIFNGNITTGCSYDPYTGNAMRTVTDIIVNGAVGEYPLALVRTANSRLPSINTAYVFERAGGWNHNYNWAADPSPTSNIVNYQPTRYDVYFPDGRSESFQPVNWDTDNYYRVRTTGGNADSSAGVRERFIPIDPAHGVWYGYLILPDGGKVKFHATQHQLQSGYYYYSYQAVSLIDPYGLATTFTYNSYGLLYRVAEPAGRYLQFTYDSTDYWRITQVTASDGRFIQYYYSAFNAYWQVLDHVAYYNNPSHWTAHYRYCAANIYDPNLGTQPLLLAADDPMYPGPMKRIAYAYKSGPTNVDGSSVVYGQILAEHYWVGNSGAVGHELDGLAVSTLMVGSDGTHTGPGYRMETRGDGKTRSFTYNASGYLVSCTDFMGHSASQSYDGKKYINSVTDRNSHRTDYTNDPITGNVTQVMFPATTDITPSPAPSPGRGTINYTYTNRYYAHTIQDEANNITTYNRYSDNRVSQIGYADGGHEDFTYDASHFYKVLTHRLKTGGTESFTYDARGLLQTYRNPSNASGNPTARYQYDSYDRVSDITDVLGTSLGDGNHTTSFAYNLRNQLTTTTLPVDPQSGGSRHTIIDAYNDDGTLQSRTDQLTHLWSYTYDDYNRLRSVVAPDRGDGLGTHTTSYYYGANPSDDVTDYKFTDSNVTYVVLPSGTRKVKVDYDDNRRRTSVIVGYGSPDNDAATTSYGYDYVGNVTSMKTPLEQAGQPNAGKSTVAAYDERNRVMSVTDAYNHATSVLYDPYGHPKKIIRPNGQATIFDTFDSGNRLLQQTVTQTPSPDAVTEYTYYTTDDGADAPVGLLKAIKDPHLHGTNYSYGYAYDSMGRKIGMSYPPAVSGSGTNESGHYDSAGRLDTFTNRAVQHQTLTYDALNRLIHSHWDDNGTTPDVDYVYDAASRLTQVNNANSNITRYYFNDNLLHSETQAFPGTSVSKLVSYTYDTDGNRHSMVNPDTVSPGSGYTFYYAYTNRNQLSKFGTNPTNPQHVQYTYDLDGNFHSASLVNGTSTSYIFDAMDRVTNITHTFTGTTDEPDTNISRTFDYDYDAVGNRKWTKRGNNGPITYDTFAYDAADQVVGVGLNVSQNTQPSPNIAYDANGNRTSFMTESYTTNNLNQYSTFTPSTDDPEVAANYDTRGNLIDNFGRTAYTYDAQNRLLTATENNQMMTFTYDGLNRQVTRRIGTGSTIYNVYDGWNLIQECDSSGTVQAQYYCAATGLFLSKINGRPSPAINGWAYHYQNGEGSASQIANTSGAMLEWYRYDLHGTPIIYSSSNQSLNSSAYFVRHLFTGQQWYNEIGLYDLRNRFYSPDIGRFIQPDPIGFSGDPGNLYRYCGNNPVHWVDPVGLDNIGPNQGRQFVDGNGWGIMERITVSDNFPGFIDRFTNELLNSPSELFGELGQSLRLTEDPDIVQRLREEEVRQAFADRRPQTQTPPQSVSPQNPAVPVAAAAGAAAITTAEGWFQGSTTTELFSNPVLLALALPFILTGDTPERTPPPTRTLYHYSENSFVGILPPGFSYTSIGNLTVRQASAGLGIPPPVYVYTAVLPANSVLGPVPAPSSHWGFGGLPWYTSSSPGTIIETRAVPITPGE